ncbi:hypothetical protein E2C01_019560 [Portunus trituberculatus]|uniref:Uncharacterized protein n=1 Tax=Portunus trituberculatus TaxID=210409 RepID=A0A5B7DXJ5_PORTR|nr:hypothetical protein [Portunus trituberculatus]
MRETKLQSAGNRAEGVSGFMELLVMTGGAALLTLLSSFPVAAPDTGSWGVSGVQGRCGVLSCVTSGGEESKEEPSVTAGSVAQAAVRERRGVAQVTCCAVVLCVLLASPPWPRVVLAECSSLGCLVSPRLILPQPPSPAPVLQPPPPTQHSMPSGPHTPPRHHTPPSLASPRLKTLHCSRSLWPCFTVHCCLAGASRGGHGCVAPLAPHPAHLPPGDQGGVPLPTSALELTVHGPSILLLVSPDHYLLYQSSSCHAPLVCPGLAPAPPRPYDTPSLTPAASSRRPSLTHLLWASLLLKGYFCDSLSTMGLLTLLSSLPLSHSHTLLLPLPVFALHQCWHHCLPLPDKHPSPLQCNTSVQ